MNCNVEKYLSVVNKSIGTLSGIGVKRAEAFSRLGIYTVSDLICHFPRAYQNRGNTRHLSEAVFGESCSYLLTVGTQPRSVTLKNRMTITKFTAFDESGTVIITYFNSRFLEKVFHVGETFRFWGKITKEKGRLLMASPSHELYIEGIALPDVIPIYPSSAGLTQKIISDAIKESLSLIEDTGVPSVLPKDFSESLGLPSPSDAIRSIHCAEKISDIEIARRFFSAEELYIFSLGISLTKNRKKSGTPPKMTSGDISDIISSFGFPLTNAQNRAVNEIKCDMINADAPMSRLLSGDVGSGKTAVAAVACYIAAKNRCQTALMAPTEILATQHYEYLSKLFDSFNIRTALLTGSTTAAEKRKIKSYLASGELDLVVGTHALITPDIKFSRLGLVITDEQHRFGVSQRARLGADFDGTTPHVLVMSATPIPRTLALILYGELSLSMLDELPSGRQAVDTFAVNEEYRERLNNFILKQVSEGGQVYIVCPTVEEKDDELEGDIIDFAPDGTCEMSFDKPKLKSAVEYGEHLKNEIFPQLSVGILHGKMKGRDKKEIMKRFSEGGIDILVSTTVIEVGVNVPNASLMIIENAERFGLAQLHQLRGRVGRGTKKAYCVLVSSTRSEKAEKRLSVMKNNHDGFKIAEFDLELRGPGDYFPSKNGAARQHGSFGAVMSSDMGLLKQTMSKAEEVLSLDPVLSSEENRFASMRLHELFEADERAMQ